jgi:DNA-binding transcriptional regulator of glucitol operon
MFIIQSLGSVWQVKNYQKAIRRVHKFGNVGFGQKRAGLRAGYIIMIACDGEGTITGGEIMQGMTFVARFKPWTRFLGKDVIGRSIYELLDELEQFDKKKQKKLYKGYIDALEALEKRLQKLDLPEWEEVMDNPTIGMQKIR